MTLSRYSLKTFSTPQVKCENFIMGCTVGLRVILDQSVAFTPLDENWIAHALYLSARSCDAIYRVWESKGKLELFYQLFIDIFCHSLLVLVLNTCLNEVLNYRYVNQVKSDLTLFKRWSGFRFFLGPLASLLHARLVLTSGRQLWRTLLNLGKKLL